MLTSSKLALLSNIGKRLVSQSARTFASLPAIANDPANLKSSSSETAVSSSYSSKPSSSSSSSTNSSQPSSLYSRFISFLAGVGVASIYFSYTITEEVHSSVDSIESSLSKFKESIDVDNGETKRRLIELEMKVASLSQSKLK
jgi:hypothetical protein